MYSGGVRRLLLLVAGIAVVVLVIFGIAAALGVPVLTDPGRYLEPGSPAGTALALGLLVADVVLPVPSSLLLAYLGAAHGAVAGAALGTAANVAAGYLGFGLGRLGRDAATRWIGEAERAKADRLLARWGILAIAATRPVPVLAETATILAGISRGMGWLRFGAAAACGAAPYAALNAAAGAEAREGGIGLAIAGAVALGGLLWVVGRAWQRSA